MFELFLVTLASVGLFMKLVVALTPGDAGKRNPAFVFSPDSLQRSAPLGAAPQFFLRTILFAVALLLTYWLYWKLVNRFDIRGVLLSYLAAPALWLAGELAFSLVALLWLPTGRVPPALHRDPLLARGVADFWGRRWNLWFSDWFRSAIFARWQRRPVIACVIVFFVSGIFHEWVINFPLWLVTGRKLFGTMMLYFLLQAAGVLIERHLPKRNARTRIFFGWLVVLVPVPLVINEGLLRTLQLWPQ